MLSEGAKLGGLLLEGGSGGFRGGAPIARGALQTVKCRVSLKNSQQPAVDGPGSPAGRKEPQPALEQECQGQAGHVAQWPCSLSQWGEPVGPSWPLY